MKKTLIAAILLNCALAAIPAQGQTSAKKAELSYPVVDSHQYQCFDLSTDLDSCPRQGQRGFGQDAQYQGFAPDYQRHYDGTVTDRVTGLVWSQSIDINRDGRVSKSDKMTLDQAMQYARQARIGGFDDWRLPAIKELYSLIMFDGQDPSGFRGRTSVSLIPFIDSSVFQFAAGDLQAGERLIDSQYISRTRYVSTTMRGDETVFGVNFIDGRIKGYGVTTPRGAKTFYVLLVRGNPEYGINQFSDNGDGSVTDRASGLTWQQADSRKGLNWADALAYCENLSSAGHKDWRLPGAKELQTLVDYSRAPDSTDSAAIDPLFEVTGIRNEMGQRDYPNYWSSTTHASLRSGHNGASAVYVAFGRSLGYMRSQWLDVHGAGSQRSDPKTGDPDNYPTGHGPQGDSIRIYNYARCVRGGTRLVAQPVEQKRPAVQIPLSQHSTADRSQGRSANGGGGRRPPQAAFQACSNQDQGDSCSVSTRRGQLNGTCRSVQDDLACVPQRRR